jgi:SAM-dependent methyltransferase
MMPDQESSNEQSAVVEPSWLEDVLVPASEQKPHRIDGVLRYVDSDSYAGSFGKEWNWFDETQLDRPSQNQVESREAFFKKTGFSPDELEGKVVLDVGCGMGRFAEVASSHGARVLGVDLSVAVDAAQRNLGALADTAFMQADVFDLPLQPESFDVIYSLGVLHHTPDTHAAFTQLPRLLRPGGRIAIWVYSNDRPRWYRAADLYRKATTRMDEERLLKLCRAAVPLGAFYRTRIGRYFSRLLPVSQHPNPEWRVLDTFDWYAPRFQWKHSWPEVEGWFEAAGLEDIRRNDFPVAVSGRRPSRAEPSRA